MTHQLMYAGAFAAVVAALALIRVTRDAARRRMLIVGLSAYLLVTHLVVGITQKDAWPITNYCLMHGPANLKHAELYRMSFFGVDGAGREWRIDPYAWRALSDWHLQLWFYARYDKLAAAEKTTALHWLYDLAERQRSELARGNTAISPLGILSAPQWWLFPRELAVPHEPYRALRVYKDTWFPADVLNDPKQFKRVQVGEWRQP